MKKLLILSIFSSLLISCAEPQIGTQGSNSVPESTASQQHSAPAPTSSPYQKDYVDLGNKCEEVKYGPYAYAEDTFNDYQNGNSTQYNKGNCTRS